MWIYGASGHGKVILDCLEANHMEISGFIDDNPVKKEFMGLPVLRCNLVDLKYQKLIVGIGENNIRKTIVEKLDVQYVSVIHPSAVVSPKSILGKGCIVIPLSVVNSGSKIGAHCIINTRSSVGHDCMIEDFVHVAPGATICGNVTIGSLTWIGAGTTIIQDLKIGRNVMIGAGSVIVNDIPDNAVVVGNPARIIRFQVNKDESLV